jgi:hypothetical protein
VRREEMLTGLKRLDAGGGMVEGGLGDAVDGSVMMGVVVVACCSSA